MTRKRFVKLLMAQGFDRNGANEMARTAQHKGLSYEEAYAIEAEFLPRCRAIIDGLGAAMQRLSESIGRITAAFSAGVSAFCEAYADAMNQ